MDDYKYQGKPANQKNEWPNALGSAGSLRLSGLAGKRTGSNTGSPNVGNTRTGSSFSLPSGSGVLFSEGGALSWIGTTDCDEPPP
jgi:hypothetical protein